MSRPRARSTAEANGVLWSARAEAYAEQWAGLAGPARERIAQLTGIGPGVRVLDAGCGPGDFCALAMSRGARTSGVDAAAVMIQLARRRAPGAELRVGALEQLPWPSGTFDVVSAINAVQFAADPLLAVGELRRVLRAGGHLAICNWGRDEDCSLRTIDRALADLQADPPPARAPGRYALREPGGLELLVRDAGLDPDHAEEIATPYEAPDAGFLCTALFWGQEALIEQVGADAVRHTIVAAAEPFRRPDGSYRFENRFRLVTARLPG